MKENEIVEFLKNENERNKMNKKEYVKHKEKFMKQIDEINKQLKKKDYVITCYMTGDMLMSDGDYKRQVCPRRCYEVCSLEEIPEYIKLMKQPFWEYEKGLSKKEIKNFPDDQKRWGRYYNVVIEPLSEEMEKSYLSGSNEGFFESWRTIRDGDDLDEIDYSTTVNEN